MSNRLLLYICYLAKTELHYRNPNQLIILIFLRFYNIALTQNNNTNPRYSEKHSNMTPSYTLIHYKKTSQDIKIKSYTMSNQS